jgi:hypothetical protein
MSGTPEKLKPHDFPVEADRGQIKSQNGTPIAETDNDKLASEIAERLNAEEQHREEDRWSA